MPQVSVIIAVYKAEPYIERCARSLFGQTLADMEFIFVDDCSPDRSIEVMQRVLADYPERAGQVKIIRHERNLGVSATRQDGVDAATGRYAIHCDPDDWVDAEMYQTLLDAAEANMADMVICDFYGSGHTSGAPEQLTAIEMLESIAGVSSTSRHGGLCNKLIKMSLLHNARFPRGISYCEDVNYLFQLVREHEEMKIIEIHRAFYHYEDTPNSICKQLGREQLDTDLENIKMLQTYKTANSRYNRCIDASVFSIIYFRAFLSGVLTSGEFYNRYGQYRTSCSAVKRFDSYIRYLMKISMNGYYRPAFSYYRSVIHAKRILRKLLTRYKAA